MTKRTVRSKSARTKPRTLPRIARVPKPRSGAMPEPEKAAEAAPSARPTPSMFRDLTDTQRMLAGPYEYKELGMEDHYDLSDAVYAGFASSALTLELGTLLNLSNMANGILQVALNGTDWMTESEIRTFTCQVALDIRERARAAVQLIRLRNDGLEEIAKGAVQS